MDVLYYESHVTVEPVFDERLEKFKEICAPHTFKPAKLLMKKRSFDTPVRSEYDTFCTGKNKNEEKLRLSISKKNTPPFREGMNFCSRKI